MGVTYPSNIEDGSGSIRIEGYTQFAGGTPLQLRSYAFTYQTAGLASGVSFYTPAVGDIIYDIGVVITTAFNGTTPKLDVGTFNGGNNGLFDELAAAPIDGTKVYADVTNNAGLASANAPLWLFNAVGSHGAAGTAAYNSSMLRVSAANPLLLVASQSGAKGGTAITSTAGAGSVLVLTATPLAF